LTAGFALNKSGSTLSVNTPELLVEDPETLPLTELQDGESIEIGVLVRDGDTIEVYQWGAFDAGESGGSALPSGLDVELLDGSDGIVASENTLETVSIDPPVASDTNDSGNTSYYKLRVINNTGTPIPDTDGDPGVGGYFSYRVV
jgi:hypothetical protein